MVDERANEVAALAGQFPRRSGVQNQPFFRRGAGAQADVGFRYGPPGRPE
jgi:hypothetical protein